jgi:hypothetical protein
MKPPGLDLIEGISPCLIQWRGTLPSWLSPLNGDPGSTQILTWHYGAQSQTVSQLTSSGTTPASKSPQFGPSRFTNHLRTGPVRNPHHILTTQMEGWDFIKSSALYLSVQMQHSLCLSFYLRCGLRGYTVGTTTRFSVKIVEALAPQSHVESCRSAHSTI